MSKSTNRQVLHSHSRKLIYEVLKFMTKEAQEGVQYDLKDVQKRCAAATGLSERTVRKIVTAVSNSNKQDLRSSSVLLGRTLSLKKTQREKSPVIDNIDRGIIKRMIHNFHITESKLPTLKSLLKKVKEQTGYTGSANSLNQVINDLGFKWMKTENNEKLLIEHTNVRLKRIEYLRKIARYREEGRTIIYTHESYVDFANRISVNWSDGTTEDPKNDKLINKRVVIVHAASEYGFVPNALLMFKAGEETGDYHNKIKYKNWIQAQLIPNIPKNSVVVVDSTPYYNKQEDAAPTSNSTKSEMESWLLDKNIQFNPEMLKPELYTLICLHKETYKRYVIDHILAEHNHTVLRFPPYHADLNPIEMAWKAIKTNVTGKNNKWKIDNFIKFVAKKINGISTQEFSSVCKYVRGIEDQYRKSDVIIDDLTENYTIRVDDNESDSDVIDSDSDILDSSSSDDEGSFSIKVES